ncbi:MAG TPA: GtrA family protein [Gammaproteobacteria bacterium]|nr:GtrA family protein [Gammaproteobacteria bacterium]
MARSLPEDSVARFALVGCTNFVVSFTAFFLSFNYLPGGVVATLAGLVGAGGAPGHPPQAAVANVIAYLAGMVNSFLLNRNWTFRASGHPLRQALRFTAVSLFSLTMSTLVTFALVDVHGLPSLAVWVPLTAVVVVVNYLGCKHWAFAPAAVGTGAR